MEEVKTYDRPERKPGWDFRGNYGGPARSTVSWGGIFCGIVATLAFTVLLLALGAAAGLTAIDPATGRWVAEEGVWGAGVWILISVGLATFLGAMLASRVSTLWNKQTGMTQGVVVWGGSMLATLIFAGMITATATQVTTELATAGIEGGAEIVTDEQLRQDLIEIQRGLEVREVTEADLQALVEASRAAMWMFFATGLIGLGGGILGGLLGVAPPIREEQPQAGTTGYVHTESPA